MQNTGILQGSNEPTRACEAERTMDRGRTGTLIAMCLGTFMAILDTSLVNLGLHAIRADLKADLSALQWVVDAYNLVYAVLILTGATLADLYGRRRLFLAGTGLFAVGSLVCAGAPNIGVLVTGRGIAGLGAACELPAALAILNLSFPEADERVRAVAIWGGMNGLAMAIGPTIGGLLVDAFGWRSLFYGILPVCAATLLLAAGFVPESEDRQGRHLDLPGQFLGIVALGALSFGFIEGPGWGWRSWPVMACFAAAFAGGVLFVVVERKTTSPLVPLAIFRNRAFSAAVADAALMTFGMYGLLFVLPLYLQAVRGQAATLAGIELLPMSLTFFLVSPVAGTVATKLGPRILVTVGMALTGAGVFVLAGLSQSSPYGTIALALLAVGLGLGLITGPIATAAVANAPIERSGMSSGLVNVGRMVGATLGVAILGIVFGTRAEAAAADPAQFLHGMRTAFLIGGLAQVAGAAVAILCFRRDSLETKSPRGGATLLRN
jgi:EmrB/QacA subfamily drug resistance transporter